MFAVQLRLRSAPITADLRAAPGGEGNAPMTTDAKTFSHAMAHKWSEMTTTTRPRWTGGDIDDLAHELLAVLLNFESQGITYEQLRQRAEREAFWYDT